MHKLISFHKPALRLSIGLALVLAGLGPLAGAPRAARAAGPYVVDSATDGTDTANDGMCISTGGGCSLRAAIQQAFNDGVPTTITFAPGLANVPQVLNDTLGTLIIAGDFITVTGNAYTTIVSGANLTLGKSIFQVSGNHNVLENLKVEDADGSGVQMGDFSGTGNGNDNLLLSLIITGSGGPGISVRGSVSSGGQRNQVVSSRIGAINSTDTACVVGDANGGGISIALLAHGTRLLYNLVACNNNDGVSISGTGGTPLATLLLGNRIGLNAAAGALPNASAGVTVLNGARDVTLDSNVISGNGVQGVYIAGAATSQITLTSNLIGLDQLGATAVPNVEDGVFVNSLAAAALSIRANTISGNGAAGVTLVASAGVTLTSNRIGSDLGGTLAVPNIGDGVKLLSGSNHIVIGGDQAAARNLISGNGGSGVLLHGAATAFNLVGANYIGTNLAGTAALANGLSGVRISGGAYSNTVGSALLAEWRNVISGNLADGILLEGGAISNVVDGNYIGLSATGAGAIPNGLGGVAIIGAGPNHIGIVDSIVGQFISGNVLQGIFIQNSTGNFIGSSNTIGLAADGTTRLGNGSHGVWLDAASDTVVAPITIIGNQGAGVAVTGDLSAGNTIVIQALHSNGGLPIDLNADGPTPNDPGDSDSGPNTLLNYPVLTASAGSVVTGTACANCTVYLYRAIGNPQAPGGGGEILAVTTANSAGDWSLTTLPAGLTKLDLTAMACAGACIPTSSTSEMSPRWVLWLPVLLR
jgi:CSLREA domain-containing protein